MLRAQSELEKQLVPCFPNKVFLRCHFRVITGPKIINFFPLMRNYSEKSSFHFPPRPFHCAKLTKKSLEGIQSYEDASFSRSKMAHMPEQEFLLKSQ